MLVDPAFRAAYATPMVPTPAGPESPARKCCSRRRPSFPESMHITDSASETDCSDMQLVV
jgi:hypothetical protein